MKTFQKRALIILIGVTGLYFGLTWFFFGSSHPCGILEARQRPYILERLRQSSSEHTKLALELMMSPRPGSLKAGTEMLEDIEKRPHQALTKLNERIWQLTPAQCLWRAIAWDADPYKVRP